MSLATTRYHNAYHICPSDPSSAGNIGTANKDETPLHWAAKYGAIESLKYLIERGADVHSETYNSERTPMHFAVGLNDDSGDDGKESCAKCLRAAGADVGKPSYYGTPLHYAAGKNADKSVAWLLKLGANVNEMCVYGTPLHWAAGMNAPEALRELVAAKANVNASLPNSSPKTANAKTTPLHWAAAVDAKECVATLIAAKADICAEAKHHDTPLHWAAQYDAVQSMKLLIKAGADVTDKDKYGRTVFHWAAWKSALNAVKYLIETTRLKLDATSADGATPLDYALSAQRERQKFREHSDYDRQRAKAADEMVAYLQRLGAIAKLNGKLESHKSGSLPKRAYPLFVTCLLDMGKVGIGRVQ